MRLLMPTLNAAMHLLSVNKSELKPSFPGRVKLLNCLIIIVLESVKQIYKSDHRAILHQFTTEKLHNLHDILNQWFNMHVGFSFGASISWHRNTVSKEIEVSNH